MCNQALFIAPYDRSLAAFRLYRAALGWGYPDRSEINEPAASLLIAAAPRSIRWRLLAGRNMRPTVS